MLNKVNHKMSTIITKTRKRRFCTDDIKRQLYVQQSDNVAMSVRETNRRTLFLMVPRLLQYDA